MKIDPKVNIDQEFYDFAKREAKRNRRTIKGQVEYMLEMAREQIKTERELIAAGKTQISPELIKQD